MKTPARQPVPARDTIASAMGESPANVLSYEPRGTGGVGGAWLIGLTLVPLISPAIVWFMFLLILDEPFAHFEWFDAWVFFGGAAAVVGCWLFFFAVVLRKRTIPPHIWIPLLLWAALNVWAAVSLMLSYLHEPWNGYP